MSRPATRPHGRSASLHCGGFPQPPAARVAPAASPLRALAAGQRSDAPEQSNPARRPQVPGRARRRGPASVSTTPLEIQRRLCRPYRPKPDLRGQAAKVPRSWPASPGPPDALPPWRDRAACAASHRPSALFHLAARDYSGSSCQGRRRQRGQCVSFPMNKEEAKGSMRKFPDE